MCVFIALFWLRVVVYMLYKMYVGWLTHNMIMDFYFINNKIFFDWKKLKKNNEFMHCMSLDIINVVSLD